MKKQESKLRSDDKKYLHTDVLPKSEALGINDKKYLYTDVLPKSEALGINDKRIFSYRRITRE